MSAPPTDSQLGEKQPSITRTLIQSFIYLSLLNAFLIIFVGMSLGPTRNIRHLAIYWACMTGSLLFLTTVASIIAHHNGKVLIWRCMFHEVYQFGVLGGLHLLPKEQRLHFISWLTLPPILISIFALDLVFVDATKMGQPGNQQGINTFLANFRYLASGIMKLMPFSGNTEEQVAPAPENILMTRIGNERQGNWNTWLSHMICCHLTLEGNLDEEEALISQVDDIV